MFNPIMKILANRGMDSVKSTIKDHLVSLAIVAVAVIFALMFFNVVLYMWLASQIGPVYAALFIFLSWAIVALIAIRRVSSIKSKAKVVKKEEVNSLPSMIHKHQDLLIPLALSALPILRKRKILATVGTLIAGTTVATLMKKLRFKK